MTRTDVDPEMLATAPMQPQPTNAKKILLIAVDNSDAALKLVDHVIQNYKPAEYSVEVVHVQCEVWYPVPGGASAAAYSVDAQHALNHEEEQKSLRFLKTDILPDLESAGFAAHATLLPAKGGGTSVIGDAICKHADMAKPHYVVMTKHSKSPLVKFFVGSVTYYCLQHIKEPLLVI